MTCNAEAPSVEAASKKWAGQVDVIGVAWTGNEVSFQGFVDKHGLTFPQINDSRSAVFSRFGVLSQPAFVLMGRDGKARTLLGAVGDARLDSTLSQLASG